MTFEGMDIAEFTTLPLARLAQIAESVLSEDWVPVEGSAGGALDEASRKASTQRRVAAGGSAHAAAPDVRRTPNMSAEKQAAAQRLAEDLLERLQPMIDLGLGYLSLNRATPTLSGGELQRLRLATQLSSKLFGVVYVLDEPSAGLHPRDLDALLGILSGLKQRGNSVFVGGAFAAGHPRSRLARRHRSRRRRAGRPGVIQRPAERPFQRRGLGDPPLPVRRSPAGNPQEARSDRMAAPKGREPQQPARRVRGLPTPVPHRSHRDLRIGQVQPRKPGTTRTSRGEPWPPQQRSRRDPGRRHRPAADRRPGLGPRPDRRRPGRTAPEC